MEGEDRWEALGLVVRLYFEFKSVVLPPRFPTESGSFILMKVYTNIGKPSLLGESFFGG
jgi:hypothetical protein